MQKQRKPLLESNLGEDYVKDVVKRAVSTVPNVQQDTSNSEDNQKTISWIKRNRVILSKPDIQKSAGEIADYLIEEEGFEPNSQELFSAVEDKLTIVYPELDRWFSSQDNTPKVKKEQEVKKPSNNNKGPITARTIKTVTYRR